MATVISGKGVTFNLKGDEFFYSTADGSVCNVYGKNVDIEVPVSVKVQAQVFADVASAPPFLSEMAMQW